MKIKRYPYSEAHIGLEYDDVREGKSPTRHCLGLKRALRAWNKALLLHLNFDFFCFFRNKMSFNSAIIISQTTRTPQRRISDRRAAILKVFKFFGNCLTEKKQNKMIYKDLRDMSQLYWFLNQQVCMRSYISKTKNYNLSYDHIQDY